MEQEYFRVSPTSHSSTRNESTIMERISRHKRDYGKINDMLKVLENDLMDYNVKVDQLAKLETEINKDLKYLESSVKLKIPKVCVAPNDFIKIPAEFNLLKNIPVTHSKNLPIHDNPTQRDAPVEDSFVPTSFTPHLHIGVEHDVYDDQYYEDLTAKRIVLSVFALTAVLIQIFK
jgi:hypothetical protein